MDQHDALTMNAAHASRRWGGWQALARYGAVGWSVAYAALGLYWTLGGPGFPFGQGDPRNFFSIFAGAEADVGGPAIAALAVLGTMVSLAMARGSGHGVVRAALLVFAWLAAGALLLLVPDARALVAVAYAPFFLVGSAIGWLPGDYRDAIPWPVLNQFVCLVGGFLWLAAALTYHGREQQRAAAVGRASADATWTAPDSAARWGRRATIVAAAIPLVYAATRWAWALGIPLGIDGTLLASARAADGGAWAGAALGSVAICGSILTLGLASTWGERFPRWVPLLADRAVPMVLAVVPAALVSVLVTAAGLTIWRRMLLGTSNFTLSIGNWAALGPELLWPIWGIALGAATLAYYLRRHGGDGRYRMRGLTP